MTEVLNPHGFMSQVLNQQSQVMKVLAPYLGGPCFRGQVMKTRCWDQGWGWFKDLGLENQAWVAGKERFSGLQS